MSELVVYSFAVRDRAQHDPLDGVRLQRSGPSFEHATPMRSPAVSLLKPAGEREAVRLSHIIYACDLDSAVLQPACQEGLAL
jgi:hypothetical protein